MAARRVGSIRTRLIKIILILLLNAPWASPALAQRLCENSDYAVASISPCTGPAKTTITLSLRRKLASAPKTLLFKRVVANGVPAQVIVPLAGLSASAPAELCTGGSGRWEVWLVDSAGTSQGVIGAFWPDCRSAGPSSPLISPNASPQPGEQRLCENSDSAVASISPCTGPSGTSITITLRRKLAAPATLLFKRVLANGVPAQVSAPVTGFTASSPPQLCTTNGQGKWEVWLVDANGTSQGVIGAFWPVCSGGSDSCLVGTWRSESVTSPGAVAQRGGSGIVLTIKTGGLATIDYNGMQPIKQVGPMGQVLVTTVYSGTATAYISANNGLLAVGTVQNSALTSKLTYSNGKTTGGRLSGLGDVFYGGGKVPGYSLNYTCNGGTLVIKHTLGPSNVLQIFTFKRQ